MLPGHETLPSPSCPTPDLMYHFSLLSQLKNNKPEELLLGEQLQGLLDGLAGMKQVP